MRVRRYARALAMLATFAVAACNATAPAQQTGGLGATSGATSRTVSTRPGLGNADAGRLVFATNCATCHGATGKEGGVGPSLLGERTRKNYDQTIAWIKQPAPPMPQLYPQILSEDEVDDVAAYVQRL